MGRFGATARSSRTTTLDPHGVEPSVGYAAALCLSLVPSLGKSPEVGAKPFLFVASYHVPLRAARRSSSSTSVTTCTRACMSWFRPHSRARRCRGGASVPSLSPGPTSRRTSDTDAGCRTRFAAWWSPSLGTPTGEWTTSVPLRTRVRYANGVWLWMPCGTSSTVGMHGSGLSAEATASSCGRCGRQL